jgi:6-phosphogluconate dehydrogenase
MQLGMIGLGRMGANITRRIMRDGHTAVAFDMNPDSVAALEKEGATGAATLEDFVNALEKPRVAWVMIPAGITGKVVEQLADLMDEGDIIIDGGNSNYREDIDRAAALHPKGIHYVDVGTSGGVWGLERGYCLMIGGEDEVISHLDPLFASIAPAWTRHPGRRGVRGIPLARNRATCIAGRTGRATS